MVLPIHDSLKRKISTLVQQGVYTLADMKRHLNDYVSNDLKLADVSPMNSEFYPNNQTIKNHIQLALSST